MNEITDRPITRRSEHFDWKVTPHWIGNVIRKELGLKTYRRGAVYYIAKSEREKLERLFERYGLREGGDTDREGETALPAQTEDTPLLE